jgi:hypothetical protein
VIFRDPERRLPSLATLVEGISGILQRACRDHVFQYTPIAVVFDQEGIVRCVPTIRDIAIAEHKNCVIVFAVSYNLYRSISNIVDKIISMEDGYQLAQIHHLDFTDDGDIVLELLLGNSNSQDSMLELVRINIKTGEAAPVHKTFKNDRLWFIGIKDGQYLYVADGKTLYFQSAGAQEPVPLDTKD